MEKLSFTCLFLLLPIWGGYTGENMALWAAVAVLLLLPPAALLYKETKKQRNLQGKRGKEPCQKENAKKA